MATAIEPASGRATLDFLAFGLRHPATPRQRLPARAPAPSRTCLDARAIRLGPRFNDSVRAFKDTSPVMRRVHPSPKYPARNTQAGTVFTAAWLNAELRERFDARREHLGLNVSDGM